MPGSVVLRLAPLPVRKLLAGAPDFALRPVALSRTRGDVCGSRRPSRCPGVRASAAARCPALLCFPRWLRLVRQLQALRALGIAPEQPQRAATRGECEVIRGWRCCSVRGLVATGSCCLEIGRAAGLAFVSRDSAPYSPAGLFASWVCIAHVQREGLGGAVV